MDKGTSNISFLDRLTELGDNFQQAEIRFWVSPQYFPTSIASRSDTDNASLLDLGGNSFKFSKSRVIGGSMGIGGILRLARLFTL